MPCHESHTKGPGVDEYLADQNDPARQTVRAQLVAALDRTADSYHRHWCPDRIAFEDCKYPVCYDNRRALDRHRAEPEGEGCWCDNCPICAVAGGHCPCYQAGTDAQREPAGRRTA